jgi:hypothetical protein
LVLSIFNNLHQITTLHKGGEEVITPEVRGKGRSGFFEGRGNGRSGAASSPLFELEEGKDYLRLILQDDDLRLSIAQLLLPPGD